MVCRFALDQSRPSYRCFLLPKNNPDTLPYPGWFQVEPAALSQRGSFVMNQRDVLVSAGTVASQASLGLGQGRAAGFIDRAAVGRHVRFGSRRVMAGEAGRADRRVHQRGGSGGSADPCRADGEGVAIVGSSGLRNLR